MKASSAILLLGGAITSVTATPLLNLLHPLTLPYNPLSLPVSPLRFTPTVNSVTTPAAAIHQTSSKCLTATTAANLVNGYSSLLTSYSNTTALTLLTADFTDTSQSINWLANYVLDGSTFANRVAFILGQGSQPSIGFTVLGIDAVGCTTVAFRWAATLFPGAQPIKGINLLYATNPTGLDSTWQIQTMYSEFNSALWSAETNGLCAK